MKVIENKFNNKEEKIIEKYPRLLTCEKCKSCLEYNKEDLRVGEFGCCFLDCPCCNQENLIADEDFTLTKDNVSFPTHFHHCSVENGAVDVCNNERVKEYINRAISYFRKNKDEFAWMTATGNLHIVVFRWAEDECYEVVVTNNYYDTYLEFKNEDYELF